ncbi:FAD-dependent monooxygenase [Kribbella sp. NPDC051587]|uniref:FAD-dependent monooxygenase n=1 Tax=Kribbella sp. NPDC051587 TaxID=3364119 RepID=UPI0037AA7740
MAGPALGYWLAQYGFEVTIVEKASSVRAGGYPIDVRGTAVEVLERMGLVPQVRAAHLGTERITLIGPDGRPVGQLQPEAVAGGVRGRDYELPRGELASLLYDAVHSDVELRFDDSIEWLRTDDRRVEVTFASGRQQGFDLVIGADGLHSRTRQLAFGPEERFTKHLGYAYAGFTVPNTLGLAHEAVMYNAPGRMAALYAPARSDTLHGLLVTARTRPSSFELSDVRSQREMLGRRFADDGWQVPAMLEQLSTADDLYFDVVTQIHLPSWSAGRVALVGDAAYAPSFFSGQGTSIALAGAYVLAGELALHDDHSAAFAAYERITRPYVSANQAIAKGGGATMAPTTAAMLRVRNLMLKAAPLLARTGLAGRSARRATTALDLPQYDGRAVWSGG